MQNTTYNAEGTLTATHPIVLETTQKKMDGRNWKSIKDWEHFEFP